MRWRTVLFLGVLAVLVGPALVLTFLRAFQPGGDLGVRLVSFTPWALPAYLLALLLVLVRVVARRGTGDRAWTGCAAALLVGVGAHAWWLGPQFLGDVPAPAAGSQPLTVMNLNIQGGQADPPRVVQTAAEHGVEVLVLSEIDAVTLDQLERYGLGQAFPHRVGRADGLEGTMVFSAYRLARPRELPTGFGGWSVDVVAPQGVVRVYAVHVRSPSVSTTGWGKDLAVLDRLLEDDSELDLLVGDLNATPDHEALRRLLDDGWRSAAEATNEGWDPTWPDHGQRSLLVLPLPRMVQIDHVLVAPSMTPLETTTESVKRTDHRAVVAEVAFR
jgi:endonuclease/exonuclease/phosphatase (EEP) superfamily protein YafD